VRSTSFLFTTLCTFIQNFGVSCAQTGAQQHGFGSAGAPRRDVAPAHAAPARSAARVHAPFLGRPAPRGALKPARYAPPVAAPYVCRARGGPLVRPRFGPYARRARSTVARRHLRRRRHGHASCLFKHHLLLSAHHAEPPLPCAAMVATAA
jgi:hypothetical protein